MKQTDEFFFTLLVQKDMSELHITLISLHTAIIQDSELC